MSNDSKSNAVNEYGFEWPPKFNNDVHSSYLDKKLKKDKRYIPQWEALNGSYIRSKALKKMVRKGIPRQYRSDVWMSLSSAKKYMLENEGKYCDLTAKSCDAKIYSKIKDTNGEAQLDIIQRDLSRTFPENPSFKDPILQNNLQDILMAYCLYKPDVGYCQGLNYVVGSLLLATQQPDGKLLPENCFWLLVALMDIIPDYHSVKMSCLNPDCLVLAQLIEKKMPQTHSKVSSFGLPIQMFVTKWFVCLFVDILPFHTVLHVWDTLFYEGFKILFRVAVYQFRLHKYELCAIEDPSQLAFTFREMFWDCKAWDNYEHMKNVFIKTGKMPRQSLISKREIKIMSGQQE